MIQRRRPIDRAGGVMSCHCPIRAIGRGITHAIAGIVRFPPEHGEVEVKQDGQQGPDTGYHTDVENGFAVGRRGRPTSPCENRIAHHATYCIEAEHLSDFDGSNAYVVVVLEVVVKVQAIANGECNACNIHEREDVTKCSGYLMSVLRG